TVGELRIGGTEPMVAGLLPAVIDRLARQHPRIAFQVTQFTTVTQFRELRERNVDLIVGRLPKTLAEEDLETESLFDEPQLVVAGLQNRWVRRRKIGLAELINEPWTLPRPDTLAGALVADTFHANGLEVPRINVSANSIHMHNALLATGRYLAMFPS